MSAFATISFILLVVTCAIWALAFSVRLAEKRTVLFSVSGGIGRIPKVDHQRVALTPSPSTFLFDRSLPAAAASGTKRVARESFVSNDGAVTINLTSPSRREIEICLQSRDTPAGTVAVIHIKDESSDRVQLIPLAAGPFEAVPGYSSGIALVPTSAPAVGISRDIKLIQAADLDVVTSGEITQSVRSATGPTRRWWRELLGAAEAGQVTLAEATISAIAAAIKDS